MMVLVLLRFIYYFVVDMNWSWTRTCGQASQVFGIQRNTVFALGRMHRDSDTEGLPPELPQRIRGRGSVKFKMNDVDEKYCKLKNHHLVDILEYVRTRNREMKGMCTVRGVQAHLYSTHQKLFKYKTVWYAMSERLGLRYKTAFKKRIVFTEGRIKTADFFVTQLDEVLKMQRDGDVIVVYMDESYVHNNHMPSKCWQELLHADGSENIEANRVERSRSKGALTVIIHACTKDGWLCHYEGDGADGAPLDGDTKRGRPQPEEAHHGQAILIQGLFPFDE